MEDGERNTGRQHENIAKWWLLDPKSNERNPSGNGSIWLEETDKCVVVIVSEKVCIVKHQSMVTC